MSIKFFISYSVSRSENQELTKTVIAGVKDLLINNKFDVIDPMEIEDSDSINRKVERSLGQADAIIAECSTDSANVMFEVGYGRAHGCPLIVLVNNDAEINKKLPLETVSENRLPSDLGDIEFRKYSSDILHDDQKKKQFLSEIYRVINNLRLKALAGGAIKVQKQNRSAFGVMRSFVHRFNDDHPLLRFLYGWYRQLVEEISTGGDSVLEMKPEYYPRCFEAFNDVKNRRLFAVADLSGGVEDFWSNVESLCFGKSERIFLIDWKTFFNEKHLYHLHDLLRTQCESFSDLDGVAYEVRLGDSRVVNYFDNIHPYGKDGAGKNLLLIEPDLVGGYFKKSGQKMVKVESNQSLYETTKRNYEELRKDTIKFELDWTKDDLRKEWLVNQRVGKWREEWGPVIERTPDYFNNYDINIRCWIPHYDQFIQQCVAVVQVEITRLLRQSSTPLKLLEIGYGTGALTIPLHNWIVNLNQPFNKIGDDAPVERYIGVDSSEEMNSLLKKQSGKIVEDKGLIFDFLVGSFWDSMPKKAKANRPYDIIFSSLVFHDLFEEHEVKRVLSECSEYLKPGGSLIIADSFVSMGEKKQLEIDAWKRRMRRIGLNKDEVERFFRCNQEMVDTPTHKQLEEYAAESSFGKPDFKNAGGYLRNLPFKIVVLRKNLQ